MSTNNPLQQFYRREKLYVPLPSNGKFYDDGVVELTSDGEVGVMPMTAADEILFKNPDMLLNGEAVKRVIASCVPAVKKPEMLLSNDVDTLIIAIRHASFGDTLDVVADCPKCDHENTFALSMENTLSQVEKLEESYPIKILDSVVVYVRPYNFSESLKSIKKSFEQSNALKHLENPSLSEEQKLKMIGQSVDILAKLNFDLVADAIIKIEAPGDNGETVTVTDRQIIKDFIANIGRDEANKVQSKIEEINNIGIKKEFTGTCQKCSESWDIPIDFNPATFFTESLQD